jgi:hypothetical protein
MKSIRFALALLFAVLFSALGFISQAWATTFSNDQSDLWWIPSESGWGIQFVDRGSTIFATMFVYDANGKPTWYTATMEGSKPGGVLTFTGDLNATTGPWFGAVPYQPGLVTLTKVGTMTWVKQAGEGGTLTYTVNGVAVTKVGVVRQTTRNDDYTGPYNAGLHFTNTGCTDPTKNGVTDGFDVLAVTQAGAAITLTLVNIGCTLSGTYAQNGQFGTVTGHFACTSGDNGSFTLSNMNVTPQGMLAIFSTTSTKTACVSNGQIGGVRNDK